jgi:hypothetical protein
LSIALNESMAIPEWLAARHLIATSAFVQIGSLFVRLIGYAQGGAQYRWK